MKLLSLHLSNVRNYAHLELEPADGLNVFVGRNAQGKSNLLEAISLLGTGKSFRTSIERDVIREGFELATISGQARVRAGLIRLACTVSAGARGTRKMYAVNGRAVRYAAYLGSVRVVTFVPSDLQLVAGPPAGRRAFMNSALAQEDRRYYHELARYQKALAQKSAVLKADDSPDSELLTVYNETLIEAGTQVMLARLAFAGHLGSAAASAHRRWSGSEELGVSYRPNVPFEAGTADAVAGAFAARLREVAGAERIRRTCLAGPHRDDLELRLNGLALAAFGSQGQHRTAVLALKVAEYTVMRDHSGEAPLLLLDDVLSELDADRARSFLEGVGDFEQSFVTATHVPEGLPPARLFRIEQARVTPFPSADMPAG
ncbi:MAG TPA: DNA replication/repair protein RecF [Candidatus Baltobacteraceae bacterium]|jgi:DNA replication and repair protein RecF|nr:DNA replication/repair protein RecF [Candidatus Baltobacteraceae bacterium]